MSKVIDFNELNSRILNTQPDTQASQLGGFALAIEAKTPAQLAEDALQELNELEPGNNNRRSTFSMTSHAKRSIELVEAITNTKRYKNSIFAAVGLDVEMMNRLRLKAVSNPAIQAILDELKTETDRRDD
ncbi:hypothetical protein FOM00_21355 [Pseudomonas sp. ST1]|uniref:hypothetical protein n=1 Tax=Pseudomonas sp. ST1 TaxID=2596897 RepID=UPI001181020A|nr:hypothetical protein [Pseudomonas sp. ST1]TSC35056.1 hypothetical protein FOM00_21355 [Pseudomonas sp. ST1]